MFVLKRYVSVTLRKRLHIHLGEYGKRRYICKYLKEGEKIRGVSVGYSLIKTREGSINLKRKPGQKFFKLLFLRIWTILTFYGCQEPNGDKGTKDKKRGDEVSFRIVNIIYLQKWKVKKKNKIWLNVWLILLVNRIWGLIVDSGDFGVPVPRLYLWLAQQPWASYLVRSFLWYKVAIKRKVINRKCKGYWH